MRLVLSLLLVLVVGPATGQPPAKAYAAFPTGEGDPDQFTCRPPQRIPDARLMGPEVCKRNAEWARYRRDGMDVAPDGVHDVPLAHGQSEHSCHSVPGATTAFGVRCD